jgi:hypothetical protein
MKLAVFVLSLAASSGAVAQESPAQSASLSAEGGGPRSKFIDPQDGKFDASAFLASAYGFLPIGSIITDPAVGYGAALGLIFLDPQQDSRTGKPLRPNIAAAGAFATENGSWGGLAGHSGIWRDGTIKTLAGAFYASLNLEFFGTGDTALDNPLSYNLVARGVVTQADWKFSDWPFLAGLRYVYSDVTTDFDLGNVVPGIDPREYEQRVSGLTPVLTFDTRDNIFTPTLGLYAEAAVAVFDHALGSDSDFQLATLMGIWYRPLTPELTLGARADVAASFGDTPFYLLPYVQLRGIQSLQLQGRNLAQAELELRWQRWGRYSLVAFAGAGAVWRDFDEFDTDRSTATGGVGLRYLLARLFGLHAGFDVAFGPDDPIFYIQVGSAWFRP